MSDFVLSPQSRSHNYRLLYPYQFVIVSDSTVVLPIDSSSFVVTAPLLIQSHSYLSLLSLFANPIFPLSETRDPLFHLLVLV